MIAMALHVGDEVIHPRYGFGTVQALLAHDREGAPVEYYEIRLADRGTLSVPVTRAAALGLRRLVNGVAATLAVLREGAVPLPEHPRHRGIELAARWVAPEPAALAGGVRDLLGYARQFGLKGVDEQWLTRACERLGVEAARVDGITPALARAAIAGEVALLKTPPPGAEPPKPAPSHRRR
jgi:RNA polymerase-interacting CarD/CdnL/TRCF family regulator